MATLRENSEQNRQVASELESAIRALLELRCGRLATFNAPPQSLIDDVVDLEVQLEGLLSADPHQAIEANRGWAELLARFGSEEEVWAAYPSASGLVLALRTPGAREGVLLVARMMAGS